MFECILRIFEYEYMSINLWVLVNENEFMRLLVYEYYVMVNDMYYI